MFIKQTLLYLPAQLATTLVQFLAVIAWTHFLLPADLGKYNLIMASHELLYTLLMWWWTVYTLRNLNEWSEPENLPRFARTESFVLFYAALIQGLLITAQVLTTIDSEASGGLVAASILFVISRSLVMYLSERMRTAQMIGLYTTLQISWAVVGFMIGLGLVMAFGSSTVWPLLGTALAQLVATGYVIWRSGIAVLPRLPDRAVIEKAARFGIPLVTAGLFGWLSAYGNRFIIDYFLGHAAVGLFGVGNGIAERSVTLAMTLVAPAALPLAIQAMREHGNGAAMERLKLGGISALALMVPASAGITMLAVPITQTLVGSEYQDATIIILPVAAWTATIYGIWCVMPAQSLILLDRPAILVKAAATLALMSTALTIALVPAMGIYGAAVARLIALTLACSGLCAVCISRFGMLFPWLETGKVLVSAGIMAAVLAVLPPMDGFIGLAAQIVIGGAVYGLGVIVLFRGEVLRIVTQIRRGSAMRDSAGSEAIG